jgi:peptide-methionine (S)-S-oxide reductase
VSDYQSVTVGGGCFWCVEAVFARTDGVIETTCGYAGGTTPNPTYEQVCTGTTGHAEVVRIRFDPAILSLADVLATFMNSHDPTTVNRQGNDVGTQYRSAIFVTEGQREAAERAIADAAAKHRRPIATEVVDLEAFYPAEEYHQRYFEKNPHAGYCRLVIAPKIEKLGMSISPLST